MYMDHPEGWGLPPEPIFQKIGKCPSQPFIFDQAINDFLFTFPIIRKIGEDVLQACMFDSKLCTDLHSEGCGMERSEQWRWKRVHKATQETGLVSRAPFYPYCFPSPACIPWIIHLYVYWSPSPLVTSLICHLCCHFSSHKRRSRDRSFFYLRQLTSLSTPCPQTITRDLHGSKAQSFVLDIIPIKLREGFSAGPRPVGFCCPVQLRNVAQQAKSSGALSSQDLDRADVRTSIVNTGGFYGSMRRN